jgi:hypothetical protein
MVQVCHPFGCHSRLLDEFAALASFVALVALVALAALAALVALADLRWRCCHFSCALYHELVVT